jgi:hypothetical protein
MPTIEPKLLVYGSFSPQDILVSVSASNRKIEPSIEKQLENLWESKLIFAKEQGRVCYNGLSYRLNSFTRAGEQIIVDLAEVEYKVRDGLIAIPEYFSLSDEHFCKGCHTGATVKTSDDRYLMIELSGKSMSINKIELMGGILELPPPVHSGNDIFASLYRKMEEEGCITKEDIESAYLRMVYLNHRTLVGFHFEVTIKPTADELFVRFAHQHADQDVRSLLHFSRDEYLKILREHSPGKKLVAEYTSI